MDYLELLFSGAFLCNCMPHLAAGLRGEAFPTPFAKPAGVGLSPPLVNVLWGSANAAVGGVLLGRHGAPSGALDWLSLALGALLMGCALSIHFGKVRQARQGD